MAELGTARKNKINLSDYPYEKDIENRLLMADFSTFDVEVLEEILFSPLKVAISKVARSLESPMDELSLSLQKIGACGLFTVEDDILIVDKEMRKYFEAHIQKFDEHFEPDMEFLQTLLKKVPIHALPLWYAIPRTSNNIFESIVEKYLFTPQIFQRFLSESHSDDPIFSKIIEDLFASPDLKIYADDLRKKYDLSKKSLEEYILHLEFHFIGCLSYAKVGEEWKEIISPFREWKDYLLFLQNAQPRPIEKSSPIHKEEKPWEEERAIFLYRHPLTWMKASGFSQDLLTEKNIREVEKSLKDIPSQTWIYFEDFLKRVLISLHEDAKVCLRKQGKQWRYSLPQYTEEEKAFIRAVILEWLFEAGITSKGTCQGKECFSITSFGHNLLR